MGNKLCQQITEETKVESEFYVNEVNNKSVKTHQNKIQLTPYQHELLNPEDDSLIQSDLFAYTQHSQKLSQMQQNHHILYNQSIILNQSIKNPIINNKSCEPFINQTKNPTKSDQLQFKNISLNPHQVNSNFQPMPIPFSVIYLLLNKNLISLIKKSYPQFFIKYQNDVSSFKLYSNGTYAHIFSQNYGILLNQQYFFQGTFTKDQHSDLVPSEKGIFITQKGKYVGQFKDGKAYGKGKYYEFKKQSQMIKTTNQEFQKPSKQVQPDFYNDIKFEEIIYEGKWEHGELVEGKIETQQFKYQGFIRNKIPHGNGKLEFKKSNIIYQGQFKNGRFQGKCSYYETPQYIYQGSFVNGKKQGKGMLVKKPVNVSKNTNKPKYLPQQVYEGRWENDILVCQKIEQVKK